MDRRLNPNTTYSRTPWVICDDRRHLLCWRWTNRPRRLYCSGTKPTGASATHRCPSMGVYSSLSRGHVSRSPVLPHWKITNFFAQHCSGWARSGVDTVYGCVVHSSAFCCCARFRNGADDVPNNVDHHAAHRLQRPASTVDLHPSCAGVMSRFPPSVHFVCMRPVVPKC